MYLRTLPGVQFVSSNPPPKKAVKTKFHLLVGEASSRIDLARTILEFLKQNPNVRIEIELSGAGRSFTLGRESPKEGSPQALHKFLSDWLNGSEFLSSGYLSSLLVIEETLLMPEYAVTQVFYATDRRFDDQASVATKYGKERSAEGALSLGICEVSIPRDHRMGALEKPSIWRFEFRQDPAKHVVLLKVVPEKDQKFWGEVSTRVEKSKAKETFVFVHGYYTTFEDAARRTAQMAYDLGFDGAPICYSWPSQGELADYPIDETNAQWTVPHLKQFLQTLAESSQAKTIHVIAHSMGNRAVSNALQLLSTELETKPCRLRQLVLAAPDIDADTFRDLAESIKKVADHVTMYISPLDKALELSKRFHGYPRLGETVSVIPGMDTIDASAVDTSFIGHAYYGDNRTVLSDIFWLLKDGKPPIDRFGMHPLQQGPGVYYAFRP
jgi:esterase/lipase superfamily enzyme